jgi:hypothetical protein
MMNKFIFILVLGFSFCTLFSQSKGVEDSLSYKVISIDTMLIKEYDSFIDGIDQIILKKELRGRESNIVFGPKNETYFIDTNNDSTFILRRNYVFGPKNEQVVIPR